MPQSSPRPDAHEGSSEAHMPARNLLQPSEVQNVMTGPGSGTHAIMAPMATNQIERARTDTHTTPTLDNKSPYARSTQLMI